MISGGCSRHELRVIGVDLPVGIGSRGVGVGTAKSVPVSVDGFKVGRAPEVDVLLLNHGERGLCSVDLESVGHPLVPTSSGDNGLFGSSCSDSSVLLQES